MLRIRREGEHGVKLGRIPLLDSHDEVDPNNLLFHAVRDRRFGRSTCFLCGRRLGTRNRSDEHVIPRWVQDRFKLWNARLNLLNGTSIPYRQLTIPCCKECNNEHLAGLEASVRDAVLEGFSSTSGLDEQTLFLWLGKIFYGLLFKEFFLKADRSNPRKGRIVRRSLLERYNLHHSFLQAARVPFLFHSGVPASILVVPLREPKAITAQFDFRDSYQLLTIAVRLGKVGIIASLQDGRAQRENLFHLLQRYREAPLHPLQFMELVARFFYKANLLNRVPKFLLSGTLDRVDVAQLPLGGLSKREIFDPWDQAEYANTLAVFLGLPLDEVFDPPSHVRTCLDLPSGGVRRLTFRQHPWPPEHVEVRNPDE